MCRSLYRSRLRLQRLAADGNLASGCVRAARPSPCRRGLNRAICLLAVALVLTSHPALGDDLGRVMPPLGSPAGPAFAPPGLAPTQPPSPYDAAWPAPGQDVRRDGASPPNWIVPQPQTSAPMVVAASAPAESLAEWYFRLDSFYWNERIDGVDFVTEYGPLSTLGYVRRSGVERFRLELFGGTVAYDGAAQFENLPDEPYHESFGTNYLGFRGEYDLLIEPAAWTRARAFVGLGTRFWIRDLRDAVTPSGADVFGYQETWWTFYPYIGLETKDSAEPGAKLFGSVRFGLTPLTYQHASYFDTVVYPRCGVTGQMELGVRFQRFSVSTYLEAMTWGESAVVRGGFQPESRMLTLGGKLGYSF